MTITDKQDYSMFGGVVKYVKATYPHAPGAQNTDTSRDAAKAVSARTAELHLKCLATFQSGDYTADEVAAILGEHPLTIRPRITELKMQGYLFDTGKRRTNTISGRSAAVLSKSPRNS